LAVAWLLLRGVGVENMSRLDLERNRYLSIEIAYTIPSSRSGSQIIRTLQAIVSATPTPMSTIGHPGNFLHILFLRAIEFRIMDLHDSWKI
jgi:hypothetical protein